MSNILEDYHIEFIYNSSSQMYESILKVQSKMLQISNVLCGGVSASLIEINAGFNSCMLLEDGKIALGTKIDVRHLSPAFCNDILRCSASFLLKEPKRHLLNAQIFNENTKKVVSCGLVENRIVDGVFDKNLLLKHLKN